MRMTLKQFCINIPERHNLFSSTSTQLILLVNSELSFIDITIWRTVAHK